MIVLSVYCLSLSHVSLTTSSPTYMYFVNKTVERAKKINIILAMEYGRVSHIINLSLSCACPKKGNAFRLQLIHHDQRVVKISISSNNVLLYVLHSLCLTSIPNS